MDSLLEFLEPLLWLISTVVAIVLFFLFVVRPLLNYLVVNYEIERHKKRNEEMMDVDLVSGREGNFQAAAEKKADGEPLHSPKASEKDAIGRLAASDPEKAGELVKKWIHNE